MKKIGIIFNFLVLGYLALITFLTINSSITYGHGLGDLIYLITSGVLLFTQTILTILIYRKQKGIYNSKQFYINGTIFLLFAIYLTYNFTLGRGAEYSWNGNIFYKID